jgi:hypothetical protein
MKFLGGNVYMWGKTAQNRFLVESLAPTVRQLSAEQLIHRFWFDRFDARGPHVCFLLAIPDERVEGVRALLTDRLQAFLGQQPSEDVSPDEIRKNHDQTRGKVLCPPDAWPGIAEKDSFLLFDQPSSGYPFQLAADLMRADEFWSLITDLSLWTIDQVKAERTPGDMATTGVRWAATLDGALRRAGIARDYWRHHATTLIIGLEERLAASEIEVLDSIGGAVGTRNRKTFTRIWEEMESVGALWPHARELVEVSLSSDQPQRRFVALREAVHCTWKQLGLPTWQHIPLVLFAWDRTLS